MYKISHDISLLSMANLDILVAEVISMCMDDCRPRMLASINLTGFSSKNLLKANIFQKKIFRNEPLIYIKPSLHRVKALIAVFILIVR